MAETEEEPIESQSGTEGDPGVEETAAESAAGEAEEVSEGKKDKSPVLADEKQDQGSKLAGDDRIISLGDKIEIYIDKPLPQYNQGEIKAYSAFPKPDNGEEYFALVCEKFLIPRFHSESVYSSIVNPCLVQLVGKGIVYWTPEKQEKYVFVYRKNIGKPVMVHGAKAALNMRVDLVMNAVVRPMVGLLQDFRDKDFVHGDIRVSNFFDGDSEKLEKVILGECLSTPASYLQPVLYETPERAMAAPIGRGKGTVYDDLYSFGVALAVMLRTHDPLEGADDKEIIQQKIEMGTFSTLTSKDRFHGNILDLLRGLLQDDVSLRWGVSEMQMWLEGTRPNAKHSVREKKAPRALVFDDNKYVYCSFLAMDLQDNHAEVVRMIDDNSLEQWISRSVEDEEMEENYLSAVASARDFGTGGAGYAERLASNLSIILDRHAPIRFNEVSAKGDGIGTALAEAVSRGKDLQSFVKVFSQNIALKWAALQDSASADISSLTSKFETVRSFMRQDRIGYGLERCLYFLCPEAPCMSEKLKSYYVDSPEAMMNAFEDLCAKGKSPALFMDRHTASYLFAKDSRAIEGYMPDLNSPDEDRKVMGNLKALATVQKRERMSGFPHIAAAFMEMLPCVFATYHDREVREKLQKDVKRYAEAGDLVKMAGLLDNTEIRGKDTGGFKRASAEYLALTKEYEMLDVRLQDKASFGRATGKEAAAVISCILAVVVILGVFFIL